MTLKIKVYDREKYDVRSKKVGETIYENVQDVRLVIISDDDILEMGFDDVDPYAEYFIVKFEDGDEATFRNSYCDVFRED